MGVFGSGDTLTVPATVGSHTFSAKSKGAYDGTLTALSSGAVVTIGGAGDGSGTAAVVATGTVAASSSGNTVTITYTAAGPISGGSVSFTAPTGWSAPATGATTVASTGTVGALAFDAQTATVSGVSLAAGETVSFTYGSAT